MNQIRNLACIAVIALTLPSFVAAQQSSNRAQQQHQSMQGMEGMHGMMQDCHKKMGVMQESNSRTRQDIAAAKSLNDPAKMRAALDEADKALSAINDHMNSCMSMMQGMHEKGMMSGQQAPSPQQ